MAVTLATGELNAKEQTGRNRRAEKHVGDPAAEVCLCHIPPGNPADAHTICVGSPAVSAHLRHGDTLEPCPVVCGGETGASCDEDRFCKRPEGECAEDAEGVCTGIPTVCPAVIVPVCGCDGTTYDNECFAAAAGATVASQGPCPQGQACGGTAGDTCGEGQFCKAEKGQCGGDAEGICTDRPQACPEYYQPVCGCDGATYDNECFAAAAGVTVASEGRCPQSQACGGSTGDTCGEGQFCKAAQGECAEDAEGTCTDRPRTCPAIFEPVCGCDGVTYTNKCMADAAGVTVASEGECSEEKSCGGSAGDTCGEGQFCKAALGECGDDADGTCTDRPEVCPATIAPVCGCDGTTYSNECLADAVGVTVDHAGPCDEDCTGGGG